MYDNQILMVQNNVITVEHPQYHMIENGLIILQQTWILAMLFKTGVSSKNNASDD